MALYPAFGKVKRQKYSGTFFPDTVCNLQQHVLHFDCTSLCALRFCTATSLE